jgi:hypothetical protein
MRVQIVTKLSLGEILPFFSEEKNFMINKERNNLIYYYYFLAFYQISHQKTLAPIMHHRLHVDKKHFFSLY